MMDKKELAVQYHKQGYNCSQAVVGVFCEELGLEKDLAMKMASGFGGGMRCGQVCGAVTGALMTLGLQSGQIHAEDQATKQKMNKIATQFQDQFKALNGTIICKELLGHDISTEEGMQCITQKGLSRIICDQMILDAVVLAEEILKK